MNEVKNIYTNISVPQFPSGNLRLKLDAVREETDNIKTFIFEIVDFDQGDFRIHPGQAISIHLPILTQDNKVEKFVRTFTVAATIKNYIELTVKAIDNGLVTSYMHNQLTTGSYLDAQGPFGEFSIVYHPKKPLLLIGAGSGLTPIMAMLRWLHERGENSDVIFIQHASTPNDILFSEEIASIDKAISNLVVIESVSKVPVGQSWSSVRGRLTRGSLLNIVPDLGERTVMCCGPDGFNELISSIHKAEGGEITEFHTEIFGTKGADIDVSDYKQPALENQSQDGFLIDIDGYNFISNDKTIVQDAADNGIRIPTSCKEGICGTCKAKLISGEVSMNHQGGLSAKEEDAGYILTCCSQPLSDIKLIRKES